MEAMCHTTKTNSMEVEENQFGGRKEKEREGKKREGKERKEKGRKGEEKKERKKKRKRGRKVAGFSFELRHSDGQNSSDQKPKFVYVTQATHGYRKQEVLAKLQRGKNSSYFGLFSTLRVVWLCLCPQGLFGRISKYGNASIFCSYTLARF